MSRSKSSKMSHGRLKCLTTLVPGCQLLPQTSKKKTEETEMQNNQRKNVEGVSKRKVSLTIFVKSIQLASAWRYTAFDVT